MYTLWKKLSNETNEQLLPWEIMDMFISFKYKNNNNSIFNYSYNAVH